MKIAFQKKDEEFTAQLQEAYPQLLNDCPLTTYLTDLKNKNHYIQYEKFPARLEDLLHKVKNRYGMGALALYHKTGMCRLAVDILDQPGGRQLPDSIRNLYDEWFKRIYNDFSTQPDFYYDHEKPLWPLRKDLSICSGRAMPVGGAWIVELRRMRLHHLIKNARRFDPALGIATAETAAAGGFNAFVGTLTDHSGAATSILKKTVRVMRELTGQYEWLYVIHTVDRNLQDFTHQKMNLAYRNIGDLLKSDRRVRGIFRESWFLDPHLKQISPELSFLWEVPLHNGAALYYAGPCNQEDSEKATRWSPARNQACKDGLYKPSRYFYIWPRDNVIHGDYELPADQTGESFR